MQPSDMDKKREAFLEHLKQKYPHHASAIMGHQERLREQVSGLTGAWICFVLLLFHEAHTALLKGLVLLGIQSYFHT